MTTNNIMNIYLSLQESLKGIPVGSFHRSLYRFIALMICGSIYLFSSGQRDQRLVLADKYFASGEYFTAADLYEQYLHPVKKEIPKANFPLNSRRYNQEGNNGGVSKPEILFKQAECYRLSNFWPEAADRYKECFEKDPVKYADAFYWYAVCQRSLGNFSEAIRYLDEFTNSDGNGEVSRKDAEKERQTIQFIGMQMKRPDTVMYKIQKTGTVFAKTKGIFGLTVVNGDQFIFSSTVTDTSVINGNNPNYTRLFYGKLNGDIMEQGEQINIPVLNSGMNQGAACMSADKRIIYFTEWEKVSGKNSSAIYYSVKNEQGWGKPVLLASVNKKGFNSKQPFCSADGKTLFFASDMPGGAGKFDIWYAQLNADGTTGEPVNAGMKINTPEDEQAPFYHVSTGDLVFASNGWQGMGGYDLFSSKKKDMQWGDAENLGYPVNSSRDDIYFYAPEGGPIIKSAIIGSDRGSECCLEIYSAIKAPKKRIMTGIVVDCKTQEPLTDAIVVMKSGSVNSKQLKTGPDGKFRFEFEGDPNAQNFSIIKEEYNQKTERANIVNLEESDWSMDIYENTPLCIEKIVKEEKKLVIKVENVVTLYFDFDKSLIKDRERQILDSVYNTLVENQTYTIQISGYTDGFGSDEYNKKLSDRRAKACADYLIKKGLDAERISFVSFGECCPVEMELINGRDNPEGRSKNRRALINISKEE